MINQKTGKRELAYISKIEEVKELEGYDKVQSVRVNNWWCVASKSLKKDDLCVYFEIDSLLPSTDSRFSFLEKKKYHIKTQRMCGTISQGLVIPLDEFPELKLYKEGDFVTDVLKVTHYESSFEKDENDLSNKINNDKSKKTSLFIKNILKYTITRKIYKFISNYINKKTSTSSWPEWVPKTDQERIENLPNILSDTNTKWIVTEKVDGCSTTYALEKTFLKNKYYVCSRNCVLQEKPSDYSKNVWWSNYEKYKIKDVLDTLAKIFKTKRIAIQGESYGDKIQKRTYSLKNKTDFVVFHILVDGKRLDIDTVCEICDEFNIPNVFVYEHGYKLNGSLEDLRAYVDSKLSNIDLKEIEGCVFYSEDGQTSFKCVSPSYLVKYHNS